MSRTGKRPTNEQLQHYASIFAAKPCPYCYSLLLVLMQRGWRHDVGFRAVWAYSNGFVTGYPEGCFLGYWRHHNGNAPLPTATAAQYQAIFEQNLQLNKSANYSPDAWGMYQVGYFDGRVQGRNDWPGCEGRPSRDLTLNDYLIYFRSAGLDPCDPFGDLPINPAGLGTLRRSDFWALLIAGVAATKTIVACNPNHVH